MEKDMNFTSEQVMISRGFVVGRRVGTMQSVVRGIPYDDTSLT